MVAKHVICVLFVKKNGGKKNILMCRSSLASDMAFDGDDENKTK